MRSPTCAWTWTWAFGSAATKFRSSAVSGLGSSAASVDPVNAQSDLDLGMGIYCRPFWFLGGPTSNFRPFLGIHCMSLVTQWASYTARPLTLLGNFGFGNYGSGN
jgi:hypothetical protein